MKKIFDLLFLLIVFNCRAQEKMIVVVKSEQNVPLSFVNVLVNGYYGTMTDSLGRFVFFDYDKPNKIEIQKIGYQPVSTNHKILYTEPEVVLKKILFVEDNIITSGQEVSVGYNGKDKLFDDVFFRAYNNYEAGTTFYYKKDYNGKVLTKIRLRAGIIGEGRLPLRVNLYDLDEKGLPQALLLKEELILRPTKKQEWFELDVGNQNIFFPKSGIAVTVELLNPQMGGKVKITEKSRPVISGFKNEELKWVYRGAMWPLWKSGTGKTYAIQLKMK